MKSNPNAELSALIKQYITKREAKTEANGVTSIIE